MVTVICMVCQDIILLDITDQTELEVVLQSAWKKNIVYIVRDDISRFDEDIESFFVEIENVQNGCHKNIVVGIIYHPPNQDLKKFSEKVNDIVFFLKMVKKNVFY